MTTSALGPRRGGWRRPVSLPADLAELRGPLTGVVRLPLGVYASGQGPAASAAPRGIVRPSSAPVNDE